MAKHKYDGYRKLPVDETMALATTGSDAVVASDFDSTFDEPNRVLSVVLTWAVKALTSGETPLVVGISMGDYTAAEIEEALEAQNSWASSNLVGNEQARRFIRTVGVIAGVNADISLADGRTIKTRLNWRVPGGQTLKVWLWNKSGATLTTGAFLEVQGHAHVVRAK